MISIYSYTNYHQYLKDYFAERKKTEPKFSHRRLSRSLGLSSTNFMMMVMQGKRNLNPSLAFKVSEVLKHGRKEAEYFQNLVLFGQAKSDQEKERYFSRMLALRRHLPSAKIEENQYEYYSSWYHPVVRELAASHDFNGDPAALAKQLVPPITAVQARRSLKLLLSLGLLQKKGKRYIQTSPFLSTDPQVNSLAVASFHRTMGRLAMEAIDRFPRGGRDITSVTMKIKPEDFETLRKKIQDFRKEIMALAADGGGGVYQVNFQAFPGYQINAFCHGDTEARRGKKNIIRN